MEALAYVAAGGNRELKRRLPNDRLPAYGPGRQQLVMLMKGHTVDATGRTSTSTRRPSPPGRRSWSPNPALGADTALRPPATHDRLGPRVGNG